MNDVELKSEAGFTAAGPAAAAAQALVQDTESAMDIMRNAVACRYGTQPWRLGDLEDKKMAKDIRMDILANAKIEAKAQNMRRENSDKIKIQQQLPVEIACEMVRVTGDVAVLVADEAKEDSKGTLAYYNRTGGMAGVWAVSGNRRLMRLMDNLDVQMAQRQYAESQLLAVLDEIAENDRNTLVAMKNGVVDISEPGSPVFTPYLTDDGEPDPGYEDLYGRDAHLFNKNEANWDPGAKDVTLYCGDGTPWSVEEHLELVFAGNQDAIKVWWQSCNFALRGMPGGRTLWYVDDSENGQGGGAKSTTAQMVANLIGRKAVLSISMDRMQQRFGLANLVGKRLLIGNETNAGERPLEGTDVIKMIARGEPIQVERKNENEFEYRPHCMVIQCMNTRTPKIKAKDAAFYRKVVILDFPATLTKSVQHDEIKDKLIYEQDVIDYIARKALELGPIADYDPDAIKALRRGVDEIRTASSTVFQFMQEYQDLTNDRIPVEVLYDCYKTWCRRNGFGGTNITNFESDLRSWTGMSGEWIFRNYKSSNGESAQRIPKRFYPERVVAECGSADIREDQNLANTIINRGAGLLNEGTRTKQYRKWLERADDGRTDEDAAEYDIRRYTEFRIAFCHYYGWMIQRGETALPDPALWIRLGQPMPYYGRRDDAGRLDYTNYDVIGFRSEIANFDYGGSLYGYIRDPRYVPVRVDEAGARDILDRIRGIRPDSKDSMTA